MLTETAYAKINLALHVRRREADGYHALETLFAFADDGDRLTLDPDAPLGLRTDGPFGAGLDSADNLVLRAARSFADAVGTPAVGAFHLTKRLPIASGIGGGSADAAAALRLLARAHGVPVDDGLLAIAAGLGADVPACVRSRATRGEGRGDRLAEIDDRLAGIPLLLVNPGVAMPTGPVFCAWDGVDRGTLGRGEALAAARAGRNDLEPPARALSPVIAEVVARLERAEGVTLARMSGSGATCFALFEHAAQRDALAMALAETGWWTMAAALR